MQASFALAAAGFRSTVYDLSEKDHDILDYFAQAGFIEPRTDDYNKLTSISTIASAIAHKEIGGDTVIAVSISGNNYQQEWLSNFTIDDESRAAGFNSAADKVMPRVEEYIRDHRLTGNLRLWVAGFSRSAAVANIFAADAVETGLFQSVYAYTFATPRTTREENSNRYHNIFNIINPFDAVPMIPFPEWGFTRYGIDLFLPAIETDSHWNGKFLLADGTSMLSNGTELVFNPQVSRELHTIFDYIAFFINSSASYMKTYQSAIIDFWTNKSFKTLVQDIYSRINFRAVGLRLTKRDSEFRYRFHEFYSFLDYLTQIIYTSIVGNKFHPEDQYWDSNLSLQENIAYNHYESTYRFWLFSADDPGEILSEAPDYIHYTILGDIDAEIYDEAGDYIEKIDRNGDISVAVKESVNPDFEGGVSDMILYAERIGKLTLIVLPTDQKFTVFIHSNIDQEIRVSYIEYSVNRLHADVRYVYYDHYDAGESFPEELDPDVDRNLSAEELQEMGVLAVEPWSQNIVYSPTSVMRYENDASIFHPSPIFLLIFPLMILFIVVYILVLIIVMIIKNIIKLIRFIKSAVFSG